ncbi:MAG: hypothetical protein O2880_01985 [Proteobacteria bacterium]|nr:hypothetical protein [Pseudomonadota bacterium]
MKSNSAFIALWLVVTTIAILLALLMSSASLVDGEYIPVGNDSFYHARRILDAAIGERGFYQFDNMIHVPEGSWINWPWGYDYLMAVALSIALWIRPAMEPMAFLAHVPVAWLVVNMGLLTLIARKMSITPALTAVGLFGFALLPLTQTLHGVGIIDHHYVELTFVLASLWAGLGFFSEQRGSRDALIFGIVLGIAPAFHNGLFILQVPALACFLVLWYRAQMPDVRTLTYFAAALVGSTLLVLLPSEPFWDMQFEFWTLSWFHLYIVCCSAIGAMFLGVRPFQKLNVTLLIALGAFLVIPLFARIMTGAAFLSGDLILLDQIAEVKSPVVRLQEEDGLYWITSFYSWLVFLTPFLIAIFAWRAWRDTRSVNVYFSIFVVFGLSLMLVQYRLHPFGSWAMIFAAILIAQELSKKYGISTLATTAATLLVLAVAFQPPLKNRLIRLYTPGAAVDYAASRSLFKTFAESCSEIPGVAISYSDDGHYIRYHTDCSVVSNNFLLTPQHDRKIKEVQSMLVLNPEEFLEQVHAVDYIFVRMYGIFETGPNGFQPTPIPDVVERNAPLFVALTFAEELPIEFKLVGEIRVDDDRDFAFVRVFRIVRSEN